MRDPSWAKKIAFLSTEEAIAFFEEELDSATEERLACFRDIEYYEDEIQQSKISIHNLEERMGSLEFEIEALKPGTDAHRQRLEQNGQRNIDEA